MNGKMAFTHPFILQHFVKTVTKCGELIFQRFVGRIGFIVPAVHRQYFFPDRE